MHFCITFCLACLLSSFQSVLLPREVSISLLAIASFLLLLQRHIENYRTLSFCIIGIIFGFSYSNLYADQSLHKQLAKELQQEDIDLKVYIDNLPVDKGRYVQFEAKILEVFDNKAKGIPKANQLQTVILNWYGKKDLKPCEIWQLTVRLKRPHGLANPGGFDYEGYLLQKGIQAKGYVRNSRLIGLSTSFCMQNMRQKWKDYVVTKTQTDIAAWIVALSIGDKALLSKAQRTLLSETGISHLFVISGLHIGLCAAAIYALILGLRRLGLCIIYPGDWRPAAVMLSICSAMIYAAFADFSIPAQRALIMLVVFMGGQVIGVKPGLWFRYWLAMSLVLLLNPLSVLNIGFVLSFAAVFVLIMLAQLQATRQKLSKTENRRRKSLLWINALFCSQAYIFMGLIPFTLLFFSSIPILAPVINIVVIPIMSFFIIPNILLALFVWCVSGADFGLLQLVSFQLDYLFLLLNQFYAFALATETQWLPISYSHPASPVLFLACFLLLLPRLFSVRLIGLLLLVATFLAQPEQTIKDSELSIDVIDVGQGLSVLLQTANHQILYDVGASWPGGSMVDMAVLPYLSHYGLKKLDKVIISHKDNDHSGGIAELAKKIPIQQILGSESMEDVAVTPCEKGDQWQWDGVDFAIVHPVDASTYQKQNNKSCVLMIQLSGRTVLLTGDIEKKVETELIGAGLPRLDVLLAPHHGSKSSSSYGMVDLLREGIVVFSSGYLNQFRHPHPDVIKRYEKAGSRQFNTALQGAIHIDISIKGEIVTSSWREQHGYYWHKLSLEERHL